ncbi:MAG: cyclophilin-like fold protein [Synergistetes bacterium]|nr:cyclophilin-like fold protein [Synergistota bacterium]MDW8191646.1 cyclophilin-like fold protein [Synergistota bacterium]
MSYRVLFLVVLPLVITLAFFELPSMCEGETTLRVRIGAGDKFLFFELNDSPMAKEFYSLLPLKVKVTDFAGKEKIFQLPRKLNTQGAPEAKPVVGTIAYYAPWGNIAIFYSDSNPASGLFELGRCVAGTDYIRDLEGTIVVERVETLPDKYMCPR